MRHFAGLLKYAPARRIKYDIASGEEGKKGLSHGAPSNYFPHRRDRGHETRDERIGLDDTKVQIKKNYT